MISQYLISAAKKNSIIPTIMQKRNNVILSKKLLKYSAPVKKSIATDSNGHMPIPKFNFFNMAAIDAKAKLTNIPNITTISSNCMLAISLSL